MARQIRNSRRGRRAGLRKGTRKGTRKGMRAGSRKGTRKGKKTYKRMRNSRRQIGGSTQASAPAPSINTEQEDIVKSLLRNKVISICTGKQNPRNRRLKKLLCKTLNKEQCSISDTDINLLVDNFYNHIVQKGGIETDIDGKVVKFLIGDRRDDGFDGFDDTLESILNNMTFDISQLKMLPQLTVINLNGRKVNGSIEHLKSLQNLTEIRLARTQVSGDIQHLKPLSNLTYINLYATDVTGSSKDLNDILDRQNLNTFEVDFTQVDRSNISEKVKHKLSPMA